MASMDWLTTSNFSPPHAAAVVTPLTLWWCTSRQDPCLPQKLLNINPTDIKTSVLSLLITPNHTCMTKLGLHDTKY